MESGLTSFCPGCVHTVIHDVRFPNEAEMVKRLGGSLVRMNPYDGWESKVGAWHESETALDGYRVNLELFPKFGQLREVAEFLVRTFCPDVERREFE